MAIINTATIESQTIIEETPIPEINKDIIERILVDPTAILKDDTFLLNNVVYNGWHASILCQALGYQTLTITIGTKTFKLFYCKPNEEYDLSDELLETDKYKNYKSKKSI